MLAQEGAEVAISYRTDKNGAEEVVDTIQKDMLKRKTKGNIIHVSSISETRPSMNRIAHASGKAALNMLTQTMALELASYGIRVIPFIKNNV